jgi:hypothetical protein
MKTAAETTSTPWCSVDESFFRLVARLFPPNVLEGAAVLLASYDDELADVATSPRPVPAVVAAAPAQRQSALL